MVGSQSNRVNEHPHVRARHGVTLQRPAGWRYFPESRILLPVCCEPGFIRLNPESRILNPGFKQRDLAGSPLAELLV